MRLRAACLLACLLLLVGRAHAARPNVIVVLTDDQGYGDVGIHGNEAIRTPHLDRFAREGVRFTRFYCEAVCAPTRASLLTGRSYYRTGVVHTSRGGAKMHGDETTLAELLRAAGYRTGVFGKWHLGDNAPLRPHDQGFETALVHASGGIGQTPDKPNSYFDPRLRRNGKPVESEGYCTDVFFDEALQFVERHRDEPFFVYLPTNAPHTPLEVPEAYLQPYLDRGLDETTARVYGMVTSIDDNFGRLLKRLDELDLRRRTLVVFLTDNGPQQRRFNAGLRGRKAQNYEGGIRVPCFVQFPARFRGGRTVDALAAHVDLLPTVLDVCHVDVPGSLKLDGRSLVPFLSGEQAGWDDDRTLFLQVHRGLQPKPYQNAAVVTQRDKLVLDPGTFSREDLAPDREPVIELYDLQQDEGETRNLAEARPGRVRELRARYDRWFASVKESRDFRPGVIHVGSPRENPTHLCRYQDANYVDGVPHGWTVRVVRGGKYEVSVNRRNTDEPGTIRIRWQDQQYVRELDAGETTATFRLPEGRGVIDVWFQEAGKARVVHTDNGTLGDATLRFLEDE